MALFELHLFGPPRLEQEGRPIALGRRKAIALLAYLAATGTEHSRDSLAALLWPEHDPSGARADLSRTLSVLNRTLGRGWLAADRQIVGLARPLALDVAQFSSLLAARRSHSHPMAEVCSDCLPLLGEAVALYQGDFLAGFSLPDSAAFDDWQFLQSETLRQDLATALEGLVRGYRELGEVEQAILYARRWLALDPLHEPAHRRLMQLYAQSGQKSAALRQYEVCVRVLGEELNVSPAPETTQLYQAIRREQITRAQAQPAPHQAEVPRPIQLPTFVEAGADAYDREADIFVARQQELARLNGALEAALAGQGQVLFVSGEAGAGKTALLREFAYRAERLHADLIVAAGLCSTLPGMGDSYLPFRNILGLLTGDQEAQRVTRTVAHDETQRLWPLLPYVAHALVDHGPNLINTFVPGRALERRVAALVPDRTEWLDQLGTMLAYPHGWSPDQNRLFEEYARVLQVLAARQPLLLLLEDLHWADTSSLGLLFYLGRRIGASRILIVGSYRPEEMAARNGQPYHLEDLIGEFKRLYGDTRLSLDQATDVERRQFVDALLDAEPNRLPESFRQALFHRSRGHALFVVEVLLEMKARGDLVQDEQGRWVTGPAVAWDVLPAKVDGLMGRRNARLAADLREILTVASVEGASFTAEVVAAVLGVEVREIVRRLSSELEKQHRLIRAEGIRRLGHSRLSRYHFRQNVYQAYLYASLDEVERPHLHLAVGEALEGLYGDQAAAIAGQLAWHYREAAYPEKAVGYLLQAGRQAAEMSAYGDAIRYLNQGLELLHTFPENDQRAGQELEYLIALGPVLIATQGFAAAPVGELYGRARELCARIGSAAQIFPVLAGLGVFYLVRGELPTAFDLARELLALAERADDPDLRLTAHLSMGTVSTYHGQFTSAAEHLRQGLAFYDRHRHHPLVHIYGHAPDATLLSYLANAEWLLGYPDRAAATADEAVQAARSLAHPHTLANALQFSGVLHEHRREVDAVQARAEEILTLADRHGFPHWSILGGILRGWVLVQRDRVEEGIGALRQGVGVLQAVGMRIALPYYQSLLAGAYLKGGQAEAGLAVVDEALATAEECSQHCWDAELYRLRGELLAARGSADGEAQGYLQRALAIAGHQQARAWQLRAATSLGRLWQRQGRRTEAEAMLAEIYGWFTEGLDTPDLVEARALLAELREPAQPV